MTSKTDAREVTKVTRLSRIKMEIHVRMSSSRIGIHTSLSSERHKAPASCKTSNAPSILLSKKNPSPLHEQSKMRLTALLISSRINKMKSQTYSFLSPSEQALSQKKPIVRWNVLIFIETTQRTLSTLRYVIGPHRMPSTPPPSSLLPQEQFHDHKLSKNHQSNNENQLAHIGIVAL